MFPVDSNDSQNFEMYRVHFRANELESLPVIEFHIAGVVGLREVFVVLTLG